MEFDRSLRHIVARQTEIIAGHQQSVSDGNSVTECIAQLLRELRSSKVLCSEVLPSNAFRGLAFGGLMFRSLAFLVVCSEVLRTKVCV